MKSRKILAKTNKKTNNEVYPYWIRIIGLSAFLFFHPFVAYIIAGIALDSIDGVCLSKEKCNNVLRKRKDNHRYQKDKLYYYYDKTFDLLLMAVSIVFLQTTSMKNLTVILLFMMGMQIMALTEYCKTGNIDVFSEYPNYFETIYLYITGLDYLGSKTGIASYSNFFGFALFLLAENVKEKMINRKNTGKSDPSTFQNLFSAFM